MSTTEQLRSYTLDDAQRLLDIYALALCTSAHAAAELLAAGVSRAKVASLYPYNPAEWVEGYARLSPTTIPSGRMGLARTTGKFLISRSTYVGSEVGGGISALRSAIKQSKAQQEQPESSAHLEYIVTLLRALTTSPAAAALLADQTQGLPIRNRLVFQEIEAFTRDPRFQAALSH
jgi:hypothetical protein